ncbi:MAG TPA: SGNH/GDSL hydrolase family protein [Steroidobacteraceae bacterium]
MTHIVLLGDSVFDNAAYTAGQPAVRDHLGSMLPRGSQATLRAVDGSRIADLPAQLERVPADATHLVVSVGGNDALANRDLLATRVNSTTEALELFGQRAASFEAGYRSAISRATASGKPLTLCTIYNGNLESSEARVARVALMIFNDAILRVGFELGIDVIDLRLVCAEPGDYANPIEPSGSGGSKIARAILNACSVGKPGLRSSRVFQV